MKKLTLGFAALLAIVAFSTTSLVAADHKCGEGKCASDKPAKCGGDKNTTKKCGEGKCGGK